MTDSLRPISAGEPLPHRRIIRSWLIPFSESDTAYALVLITFDFALLLVSLAAVIQTHGFMWKAVCGLVAGFVIGRLFIIGHDACHQSLTRHRKLNRWLGRVAFLPSLTPYSLWEVGHNVIHHGYTNLKGVDFVWAPLSVREFRALSGPRRILERVYRSGWAPGLYYMIEIWWRRMFFPSRAAMPTRRPVFLRDCVLVSVFALFWIGTLVWAAYLTDQPAMSLIVTGFAIPFLFWCAMVGFVVYVHHTHTRIRWYDERAEWGRTDPFVSTTVHLTFRRGIGALFHQIMEHTAHHVDMSLPLYRLAAAQRKLEEQLPGRIVVQPFSWRWYFGTAQRCKLYDFASHQWTDFAGRPTV
ncbi:omega-6 fatty acid desaturase (delta-12 desaturase) [Trinickia symbiotica]|uniref:Fatty acid desaturase n=1 Tax=Trinickia symbiotica TaxID=863227 RepID=A0A2N7WPA6_9BURK|nr:fatty acid desaturase [Trinickia symbiotica]PMS31260.1 fatty acid desaturase [Trinickia symbiotica]PPK41712.1 omega-6 fatty acid desaturase (delta-12 desaturase) [Trinickia symbiotica]